MADSDCVRVILPRALIALFADAPTQTDVPPGTVAEMLDTLDARWPGMAERLRDTRPAIRQHINVFVAGNRATLATPLPAGSEVVIMTAMSGG